MDTSRINVLRLIIVLLMVAESISAQQIAIPRIDQMPDFPQPYLMRNWKQVARGYDSLVFNETLTGQYLPLVFFRETNINYPNHASFGLHTAVGTVNPASGEAINVIPAVVGASLVGIDKSNQFGQNWALLCEEYFNKRPEENIYLNHPETTTGDDWWYETMPNIFFLQLNDLYPHLGEFDYQVKTLADQWLAATTAMGGSATPWNVPEMNYRAWSMSTMMPLETGVKEPEAAGAIAWILYNAYNITRNRSYLMGAEWCLEFLNSYPGNPSYELQLPYGVYAAARLNAEIGTGYDIEKMVNWCFNRGELRGWGAIVGKWGDYDCSGLIGEANDAGNDYAFAMNGYEQAGALVPMVRYDDRFATAIAKWVLNLANASRLFYSGYLPDDMQDNEAWAGTYDANAFIGYESLKENKNNKSPYATGDAVGGGWASTNLMLYSSSHAGILGGIIDTTNVEGILRLDLLKTDYYRKDAYPTYLYYNPNPINKSVFINLPAGSYDLYDAITNSMITTGINGNALLNIPSKNSVMIVIIPAGSIITTRGNKSLANNIIIDYNNGTIVADNPPRIKALEAQKQTIETNTSTRVYCTATDPEQEMLVYEWTVGETKYDGSNSFDYSAPGETGGYTITCKVLDSGNQWDTLSIRIEVVDKITYAPEISKITASRRKIQPEETIALHCLAQDEDIDALSYEWTSRLGTINSDKDSAWFTAPNGEGNFFITCRVTDVDELATSDSIEVMVRNLSTLPAGDLVAQYPMNGNANDQSGNKLNGLPGGVLWVEDRATTPAHAAYFDGSNDNILVSNNEILNFQDAISISCWINVENFSGNEQHPVSHGSWENRFKISISNHKIRFTLNTSFSVKDLDSETELITGKWYFLTTVFDGRDMEIWLDGKLDAFTSQSGRIKKTTYDLVFGQNLPGQDGYNFNGALDDVSIFNYALSEEKIRDQMEFILGSKTIVFDEKINVFPNPVTGNHVTISVESLHAEQINFSMYDLSGRMVAKKSVFPFSRGESSITIPVGKLKNGVYLLSIKVRDRIQNNLIILSK